MLAEVPGLAELEEKINKAKTEKAEFTEGLLIAMRETQLKSWKTEQASYSRSVRKTAKFDPIVKKQIEDKLKKGEEVPDWTLEEREFVSIRLTK